MGKLLVILVLLTGGSLEAAGRTEAQGTQATVIYLEGELTINGKIGEIGDVIPDGAVLKTGANSLAEIQFSQRNALRLGPQTVTQLSLAGLKKSVDLRSGSVWAVLKKLDRLAGGSLELRTPAATGAVRGTSFFTQVDPSGSTYFCTCNGSLVLQSGDKEIPTSNPRHGAWEFLLEGPSTQIVPAGLKGHDDGDLETLAARIGVSIDWTKPDDKEY